MVNRTKFEFFCGLEYEMWDFHIKPILAGKRHEFDYEGHHVVIRMPSRPKSQEYDEEAAITCQAWRTTKKRMYPIEFGVHRIRVEVHGNDSCTIRERL